jgi:glucosamine-6-phosphate deaminase
LQIKDERPRLLQAGTLKLEIHGSREKAGRAASLGVAEAIKHLTQDGRELSIIFATGASQLAMLSELTSLPGIPWERITGFHMDEYEGLQPTHFASFRRYLRENLTQRVPLKEFHEMDGTAADLEAECRSYSERLRAANPKLCLMGIGENGHLAFNDPHEANFHDPLDVRLVKLDKECREQQVAEGWFPSPAAVPVSAITLTIPALFRVPQLFVSVPGSRKAKIVRRVIDEPISTALPATLLKTHPDATVYLDVESSAGLGGLVSHP